MSEELFPRESIPEQTTSSLEGPLAVRMRPRTLEEVVGQEHLLGGIGSCDGPF